MEGEVSPYVIPLSAQKPKTLTLVPADPGSRYKVRQLQVQVVGKSKMIRTVLVNILDVAKDMLIPPSYIGTFMGYVIGAQAKFDPKKPERQQAFISGEHDTKDLSKIMVQFINEVLSCPNCSLPELTIKIKGKTVSGVCRACGEESPLSITDEKFKRYIINHPPTSSKDNAFQGNKQVKGKEEKPKKEKKSKDETNGENGEAGTSTPKATKEKRTKGKVPKDDVIWYSDTSEEAARKRREALLPESMLGASQYEADINKMVADKASIQQLAEFKKEKNINDADFITLLFTALFDADLQKELEKNKATLEAFVKTEAAELSLIHSIVQFATNLKQLAKLPLLLKAFYDVDILEEDTLIKWFNEKGSKSSKEAKESAKPFIVWLKEAEVESDEEEGEEEGEDEEEEEEEDEEEEESD